NNDKTISRVIDSLAKINDNFLGEFIIINHSSEDNSLRKIKSSVGTITNVTVITQAIEQAGTKINHYL
ncbi:MAG: hypothetical protein ACRYE9_01010, partial [Janthinobacterium lividum]